MSTASIQHAKEVAEAIADATDYDRIEDFAHVEGRTLKWCFACRNLFRGHPSRIACRRCATTDPKQ